MQYKVSHISIKKLRNVLDVSFELDDHLVKISGENGAGKSTIVDAIFLAIQGKTYIGRGRATENLITKNHDKAEIEVTLTATGKSLKIIRSILSTWDVKLDIVSSTWEKLYQKDLDDLLSEFTIDPLEFTRKSKKEQYEIVKQISGVDTASIDAEIQDQEIKTQGARSIAKTKSEALKDHGYREKVEAVDVVEYTSKMQSANDTILAFEKKEGDLKAVSSKISSIDQEIEAAKARLMQLEQLKKDNNQVWADLSSQVEDMRPTYEKAQEELTEIKEKVSSLRETNQKADEYKNYLRLVDERDNSDKNLKDSEDLLEQMRDRRKKLIEGGNMPVEGLTFSEAEGVLINGLPIDQLSSAQQLLLACKIATSQNPSMKVIYIKDGSLLDAKSMEEVTKLAASEDYQIFIERVGEEVDSIVMRDGAAV